MHSKREILAEYVTDDKVINDIARTDGWLLISMMPADCPDYYEKWYRSLKDEGLLS